MALPLNYNLRNVLVRWRSTLFTILGIALVVAVYAVMQAMAVGLAKSSQNTGDPRNMMVVRKGSTAESSSQVLREQVKLINYLPQIARDEKGRPLISPDVIVLFSLPRRDGSGEANVLVRGISPLGLALRPQVKLVAGRWFTPGKREVVVTQRMSSRFANFEIGGRFRGSGKELTVVGIMDGGNTAFDSEVWMDADEARSIFEREHYSSVLLRVTDEAAGKELAKHIETDKRLPLQALPETDYYSAQTKAAAPIRFLGNFLATAMSIGAIFAAMNTMYATVGARTREIGTLRVLGFRRRAVLASFLLEGALLSMLGGLLGCLLSVVFVVVLHNHSFGTLNFQTWGETVFQFQITPVLLLKALGFSLAVGVLGSLLPSLRASRLPVIAALKSV